MVYIGRVIVIALIGLLACEPPVGVRRSASLSQAFIVPQTVTLLEGLTQQFGAYARTDQGDSAGIGVTYSATGGTITPTGVYTAGTTPGTYSVVAHQADGALADTAAVLVIAPVAQGDQRVLPPGPPPSLPRAGASTLDPVFGHRLIRLTDATLCPGGAVQAYSYWAALNLDDTRLLAYCSGVPTIFQVDLVSGTVASLGGAFRATPMWWEGTIWSRSVRTVAYGIYGSTANARLLAYDFSNQSYAILKDLHTDTRFTSVFASSTYLWQLSADTAQKRFAATVRASGSGNQLGAVVWDRTTDQVWTYALPSGYGLDEVQLDHTGGYLVIKLGGSWQVWRLTDPSPGPAMANPPGHSDNGDVTLFQGHGAGLRVRTLDPPSSGAWIFTAQLVAGKTNPYADAHTSTLPADGWVYFTTHTDQAGGGLHAPWSLHSGSIYKVDYSQELALWPQKLLPEVVRMGSTLLTRVNRIPTAPGQWYLDAANQLYVWNPNGANPATSKMVAFDWRPIHEEIVRVSADGTRLERLAHHYSLVSISDYSSYPRSSASYDGRYVVFNSNWGGSGRIDVYAVQVQP